MAGEVSFEAFVRANSQSLLRTAYLLAGSRAPAEDLVQDTLTRLYPQWHRVEQADVPTAYVRRALTNGFLSSQRRRSSQDISFRDLPDGWDGQDMAGSVVDRELVWTLLAGLQPRQRTAVVLRYFHDLTDDQIAEQLGCRPATVRSMLSRSMGSMRRSIDARHGSQEVAR